MFEANVAAAAKNLTRIPSRKRPSIFTVTITKGMNPDFQFQAKSGKTIYLEAKGRLLPENVTFLRNLDIDLRPSLKFVLQSPYSCYGRPGSMSVAEWMKCHGYEWTDLHHLKENLERWYNEN
jgi:hypothetical protein